MNANLTYTVQTTSIFRSPPETKRKDIISIFHRNNTIEVVYFIFPFSLLRKLARARVQKLTNTVRAKAQFTGPDNARYTYICTYVTPSHEHLLFNTIISHDESKRERGVERGNGS